MQEDDILRQLALGNQAALRQMFDAYYVELVRHAIKYVKDEIAAEEIVQELFIKIWERRYELSIKSSLKAYLLVSVKFRALNYLRLQLPKDQNFESLEHLEDIPSVEDWQSEEALKREIHRAIDQLPPKCRAILIMSKIDGMSHKEIAAELNISEKTVENQITIAFKKLKMIIDQSKWNGEGNNMMVTINYILLSFGGSFNFSCL